MLLLRSPEERTKQQQSFVDCLTRVEESIDQVAALGLLEALGYPWQGG